MPDEGTKYICLSAIVIDSVIKSGKSFFSFTFLEVCKCKIKKERLKLFITEKLESAPENDGGKDLLKNWVIHNVILIVFLSSFISTMTIATYPNKRHKGCVSFLRHFFGFCKCFEYYIIRISMQI